LAPEEFRIHTQGSFFPHNERMRLREALHRSLPLQLTSLILCLWFSLPLLPSPLAAKTRPDAGLDAGYVTALAAADHFLQAWQSGDVENGMALLTSHAKEKATTDALQGFFSNSGSLAYEIDRGKLLKRGRYEFPVVLVSAASKSKRARRIFSSIVIVDTGHNDWAVDKLP
jgi:hypothetical protein